MTRRSAIREVFADRLLIAALAVVWVCALFPIWVPRFLPLLDFPNHLAAMAILHRHADPSWGYQKFYTLNLKPAPYWGHYFPVHLMAYVVPLEIANKIWISLYALALPLGVAVLARQLRRSPWLMLFAAPLVFGYCFGLGFISFCGGVAVFPWALWALEAYLDEPSWGRGVALTLLSLTLYLMHVMPWVVFGLCAGVILCSRGWRPRAMAGAAGFMLISVVLALAGMLSQKHGEWATAGTLAPGTVKHGDYLMRFEPWRDALKLFSTRCFINLPRKWTKWMELVLALPLVVLHLTGRRSKEEQGFRWRYELALVICVVLYFELPQTLYEPLAWWYIAGRMTAFVILIAFVLPRGPIELDRGWRRFLLAPAAIVALAYPLLLARNWYRWDERTVGFQRLMKQVPRGSSTLVLMLGRPDDPDVDPNSVPFLEFHALAQVLGGGFDPWAQATPLGGFPMSVNEDQRLPAPYYSRPQAFSLEAHGMFYDYILTRNEHHDHDLVPSDRRAPLLAVDGAYRLYQVRHDQPEP